MGSSCNYGEPKALCLKMMIIAVLMVVILGDVRRSEAFGTFGFDIHHRYSDPVKGVLDLDDGLPEMGTREYYAAMAHRDSIIKGRRLADTVASSPITFAGGNETVRINSLGFLHYANVTVGTPGLWFLVALDTGSDLFWLPCDCAKCVGGLVSRSGQRIDLNIYSPSNSSTSMKVPCNSSMCGPERQCSTTRNACAYQVNYLSNGTSSTGILVEDILHLATDDRQQNAVDAQITFGCGIVQTGGFLDGAAPNGLFGLGISNTSVPSILANKGLAANSFSMCFGPDGVGRIVFGDKGSSGQGETPFTLHQPHPTYNISMTQIRVGSKTTDLDVAAIFDTGTSFTYLNDPAYTVITENFNSQVQESRDQSDMDIPFEYCYDLSENQTSFELPGLVLTMKGGSQYNVTDPIVIFSLEGDRYIYCLAVVKSGDVNIIGQNFMTGYRVVFNREKMVLGWKASNCYDTDGVKGGSNTLPIGRNFSGAPSPAAVVPEATSQNRGNSSSSNPALPLPGERNHAPQANRFACTLLMLLFSLFSHYMTISS